MALIPLTLAPGMFRNGTEYQSSGRWFEGNLVRWYESTIRPVGGWMRASSTAVDGTARGIFAWRENDFDARCAIGTDEGLFIYSAGSVYDITPSGYTPGRPDSAPGIGFGLGAYGAGSYGVSTSTGEPLEATTWSLDSWGEKLVGCASTDGKLYEWSNDVGVDAAVISGAPDDCIGLIVTPERHLVALAPGGVGRNIAWCSQEDNTDWTPTPTNTAGDLQLQTDGRLVSGLRVRRDTLLFTQTDVNVLQYKGPPLVYGVEKVGSNCGPMSSRSPVAFPLGAAWMGRGTFFQYDGTLRALSSDVSDYIFSDFNYFQSAKVHGGHNAKFGEIIWHYCSEASNEVDRYVIWNYRENHWATGSLARLCWTDSGVFKYPLAVDAAGYIYEHENGWTNNGAALSSSRYLRSGPVEIGSGEQIMHVMQILPDERTAGDVQLEFKARYTPEGSEESYGPYTVSEYTDVRFSGRQVSLQADGLSDSDWRLGNLRLDVMPGGKR